LIILFIKKQIKSKLVLVRAMYTCIKVEVQLNAFLIYALYGEEEFVSHTLSLYFRRNISLLIRWWDLARVPYPHCLLWRKENLLTPAGVSRLSSP
jgi:hypothetical protein